MDSKPASGWIENNLCNSEVLLDTRQELLRVIGNRLFVLLALAALVATTWAVIVNFWLTEVNSSLPAVFFTGILGGIIGLQNRLMDLTDGDLLLLTKSLMYLLLAPLVGGFMAALLYVLFISGLLSGDLFPSFSSDGITDRASDPKLSVSPTDSAEALAEKKGIGSIFLIHATSFADYGKLIFWSFVAGFSERFVTRIISRFEASASETKE